MPLAYKCEVVDCHMNRYWAIKHNQKIRFHKFPMDLHLRRKWTAFANETAGWKPSKKSAICSMHFREEDYMMNSDANKESWGRLRVCAVPSIKNNVSVTQQDADHQETFSDVYHQKPINPMLLKHRDQFCRTCLKYCQDSSAMAVSVESKIQNMTLLDMLVHLTAFEADDNDAFPTVICLECKTNLENAFNIRQQFINRAEYLVQLVAEGKLVHYYHTAITKAQALNKPKTPKRFIFTDINQAYRTLSIEHPEPFESPPPSQCSPAETLDEKNVETIKHDIAQTDKSDLNDHSCYTKVVDENEDPDGNADVEQQVDSDTESTAETEDACTRSNTPDIQSDEHREQNDDWHKFMVEYEKEKSMKRKLKAEQRRALKSKQDRQVTLKLRQLEEEARRMFPLTTCYICDKQHDSMMDYEFHMREHIPMLPYQCNECLVENNETTETGEKCHPLVLKTTNLLNQHFRMHRLPHKCDKCYRQFETMARLKRHNYNAHDCGENGFTCEYCGKQYFHKIFFRKHVRTHRYVLDGLYKCSFCERTFGVKGSLQRHEASHKGERKYKCMYCDKSFSTSYNRLNHHRIHTGERPHKCLECGQAFSQKTSLLKHTCAAGVAQERRSKLLLPSTDKLTTKDGHCPHPGCDYTATTYGAMYVHKRTKHRTLYQCEMCNKSYPFASLLNAHVRLHTGERPYQCNLCGRSYRVLNVYQRHLKTHTTECNYVCDICQKSFKLPQYLQAHIQTHSSERKFSCEICGNCYKTKGELTKHTQRKHAREEHNVSVHEDEFIEEVPTSDG